MKRVLAVLVGFCLALVGTMAVAAWLSTGSATASVTATTVNQANSPTATRGDGDVTLSWAASTLGDGSPVGGYVVLRHDGSGAPVEVCTSATTSCTDPAPLATAVSYGVVATIGTSWRGAESALTAFTYDDHAPSTTASVSPPPNAAGWSKGPATQVTVTLHATDSGNPSSGVDHITHSIDGGTPVDDPGASASFSVGTGTHTVTYFAVDDAGNIEATHSLSVKVDPNAPVTTLLQTPLANGAGWNKADVTLDLTATDADSGVRSVTVDGVTTTGSTATKTISAEGTHQVLYFATDVADNVEGTKTATVRIDKTAPTASIDPAGGSSWTNDNTVAITRSDALSGLASTQYAVDGGALQSYTTPVSLADGTRTFRYVVTDVAGNVLDQTATIKVDTVKPVAALSQVGSGQPTISGTDATSGVASVSWRDGGTGAYTTVTGASTTLALSNGSHTVWFFTTDNAGNSSDPQSRTLTIGAPAPAAPVLTGCGGANGSKPFNLTWSWGPGNPNGGFKLYADLSTGSFTPLTFGSAARSGSTPDMNSVSGTFKLVAIVDGVESAPATADFVANGAKTCTIN